MQELYPFLFSQSIILFLISILLTCYRFASHGILNRVVKLSVVRKFLKPIFLSKYRD